MSLVNPNDFRLDDGDGLEQLLHQLIPPPLRRFNS